MADYSDEDLKLMESVRQEERQRIREEIEKIDEVEYKSDGRGYTKFVGTFKKEVLALLSEKIK